MSTRARAIGRFRVGSRGGAEWGRHLRGRLSLRAKRTLRFEVVREGDHYRVRDTSTGEFVGVAYRFADAAEQASELERGAHSRFKPV